MMERNFGWALSELKQGKKLTRHGWAGKFMWIAIQVPDSGSANTLPYIYLVTGERGRVPWVASHSDILNTDWDVVE